MIISKVVSFTKLTKKAIRYYESVGLIESTVLENGYRDYSKDDLDKLVIIKSLRYLTFSIEEIKLCFNNKETLNSIFLSKLKDLNREKTKISTTIDFLNNFVKKDYTLNDLNTLQNDLVKINKSAPKHLYNQLRLVFPGVFGEVIAAAYGQFLDEEIVSLAQKEAWDNLLMELDEIDSFEIPQNLIRWAKTVNSNSKGFKDHITRLKDEYNQSYEEFNTNKRNAINQYIDQANNDKEKLSNDDLIMFLSTNCKELVEILARYLPLVSKSYEQFFLKQKRFFSENSLLIDKLNSN